jgi:hypothetical protein
MKRESEGKKFRSYQRSAVRFREVGPSLGKGGTSKKRPSPHLDKVASRINKVSPRTFQTALVDVNINRISECMFWLCQVE